MGKTLTVSQLNNYIKGVFDDELFLQDITVTGEIFEFKVAGKNSYITLKEGECSLSCVYFSSIVEYKTGQKVCATGRAAFYPKSGKMSFNIAALKLTGRGELLARLEETKARLQKEGVFDNRRSLPVLVKNVAILTSSEGAVIHDFLEVVKTLNYLRVTVFDIRVQGEGANKQIISAMSDIGRGFFDSFDVILLARGGGGANDLNEFNSEELARNIHKSKVPVVSAIGHETDFTLSDFAADIRAGTPSIAGGLIVENNRLFFERFFAAVTVAFDRVKLLYRRKLTRLSGCARKGQDKLYGKNRKAYNSIVFTALNIHTRTKKLYQKRLNKCAAENNRQYQILSGKAVKAENQVRVYGAKLGELNPAKILSKGYAKIYKDHRAVKLSRDLTGGDDIQILMSDGKAEAVVK
ncbi:MAG: exodeoxyribonuclease VII large subunit [Firmicutes bacterium]|nr:exodeoxyribonuclease VII large subunit [Bacillota bacterium]